MAPWERFLRENFDSLYYREHSLEDDMKELFPGNYTLVEYYDPSVYHFRVRLQFDDPRDKVIFLLKYSS